MEPRCAKCGRELGAGLRSLERSSAFRRRSWRASGSGSPSTMRPYGTVNSSPAPVPVGSTPSFVRHSATIERAVPRHCDSSRDPSLLALLSRSTGGRRSPLVLAWLARRVRPAGRPTTDRQGAAVNKPPSAKGGDAFAGNSRLSASSTARTPSARLPATCPRRAWAGRCPGVGRRP